MPLNAVCPCLPGHKNLGRTTRCTLGSIDDVRTLNQRQRVLLCERDGPLRNKLATLEYIGNKVLAVLRCRSLILVDPGRF